jgi:hypothetical protein
MRAYVWGYALILAARLRQHFTSPEDPFASRPPTSAGAPLNTIGHQRKLADPTLAGVAPNVDTLYSLAWLDLSDGPFVLDTPAFGSRYYSFQFGNGDTSAEISVGIRTHGSRLPLVFVRGPGSRRTAPAGMLEVASHTRYAMVAGRILVQPDDPGDHDAVHELQRQVRLRTLDGYLSGEDGPSPVSRQRLLDDGAESVDPELVELCRLGNVLRDWIVDPREYALVDSFGRIGLTPESGFEPRSLTDAEKSSIARGLADGADLVERKSRSLGRSANGWTVNHRGPRFDDDYLLRAAVAKEQIYVTVPEEALYPVAAVDADGRPLSGEHAYRIAFDARALPPADAFWSLTMYMTEGHPLVPNPIGRYAIGDRTAGLVTEPDGSLAIHVQCAAPPRDEHVNWLPAPAGPFRLMMRLYWPRASALDGSWVPPPVERVGPI